MPRDLPARLWPAALIGTLPLAWAAVQAGFGLPAASPPRDLALLVLASVTEEIVFRGGLQRALLHWRRRDGQTLPAGAANLLTSAVFAAAHVWNHPPLAALGVLPVSLLLGWVYERSGERLQPPIALHLYFNLVLYGFSFYAAGAAHAAA